MSNRRNMLIPVVDAKGIPVKDQGNNPIMIRQDYEQSVKYEIITLVSAIKEYWAFSKKATSGNARNYSLNGLNPLDAGNGHILGVQALLLGPSGAVFDPQATGGGDNNTNATAWLQALAQLEVETYKNKDRYQHDHGFALFAPPPVRYRGLTPFAPALWDQTNGTYADRQSKKLGIYYKDPVMSVNQNTQYHLRLNFNTAPGATLDTFQILLLLLTREFPEANPDHFNG
jgi:hypothetical protein